MDMGTVWVSDLDVRVQFSMFFVIVNSQFSMFWVGAYAEYHLAYDMDVRNSESKHGYRGYRVCNSAKRFRAWPSE